MTSYSAMIKAITLKFSNQIDKAARILYDCLNVNQFYYCKITEEGLYSSFDSNALWADYFASEKLYLNYPYFCAPMHQKTGISIIKEAEDEYLKPVIKAGKNKFNLQLWFRVVNKIHNGIEEYGFSSPCDSDKQMNLILNESKLLHLFIKNFKKENVPIFRCIDECQINIAEMIGPSFYRDRTPLAAEKLARKKLLQKMGIEYEQPLSTIESDVVNLMLEGYSASESASQLFRSKRTVEHHIERIKDKLECSSRSELIQKANILKDLGFLMIEV